MLRTVATHTAAPYDAVQLEMIARLAKQPVMSLGVYYPPPELTRIEMAARGS